MQIFASLDIPHGDYCFIQTHYTGHTWSNWYRFSFDRTCPYSAKFDPKYGDDVETPMRVAGYPIFPVDSTKYTYDDLYELYLIHKDAHPEFYI